MWLPWHVRSRTTLTCSTPSCSGTDIRYHHTLRYEHWHTAPFCATAILTCCFRRLALPVSSRHSCHATFSYCLLRLAQNQCRRPPLGPLMSTMPTHQGASAYRHSSWFLRYTGCSLRPCLSRPRGTSTFVPRICVSSNLYRPLYSIA